MKQIIPPDLLAENKAKLMAQVDSLTAKRIPREVEPELIAKALFFYSAFKEDIFDVDSIDKVIEAVNLAIYYNAEKVQEADGYVNDAYFLSKLSTFLTKGALLVNDNPVIY